MDPSMLTSSPSGRSLLKRISKQCGLWRDYYNFTTQHRWLAETLPLQDGKDILIVNFTDWIPRAKLDSIIAKAFALRGYRTTVLTKSDFVWSQRYLRYAGVDRLITFDQLLAETDHTFTHSELAAMQDERRSFAGLYTFNWHGIGVGRHVLSTVVRRLFSGSAKFDDPRAQELLTRCFPESMRAAAAAELLFDRIRPQAVLFLEKGYTPYGELFDAALARGINTIQYHHGHRSDLLNVRRYTPKTRYNHPFSLSPESWNRVRTMPWSPAQEEVFMAELKESYADGSWFNRKFLLEGKRMKSSEEVRSQLRLDPAKKTAVIFSHVLWDATFFFGENLFPDYEQWLVATVKAACENLHVNWIIKLHPDYAWKVKALGSMAAPRDTIALEANIGTLPDHIQVVMPDTDISTYSFFQIADACITVRGTVGIEAPCFGVRTFTAGTGRYSGMGFTDDSATVEEYLGKMRAIHTFPRLSQSETTLARKHAYGLFNLRPLHFTSCEIGPVLHRSPSVPLGTSSATGAGPVKGGSSSIDQDAIIRVHSLKDVEQAADLQAFVQWVLESKNEDYLAMNER